MINRSEIVFGDKALGLEEVHDIARATRKSRLSAAPPFVERISAGVRFLDEMLARDGVIYGVTTGYGDSCTQSVPLDLVGDLPINLTRFHGCGLGRTLNREEARAVVAVRLASLCHGMSGVSMELLQLLAALLDHDAVPVIPAEGSVGASGDLTPLSYVAAVLIGERDVIHEGAICETRVAFERLGLRPIRLRPKEALAIMNGTSVMTALAVLAYMRADYMTRLASRLTAMSSLALLGNPGHFDPVLFRAKPHPGQERIATRIRSDIGAPTNEPHSGRLQDRYSIRCAPHVIGVLQDALPLFRQLIETELNSANDNPLVDPVNRTILHGGHFYGGHIAFVMDSLKVLVANISDLMDRQLALLVDEKFNNGLPANLSGAPAARRSVNHGLKAVQIAASAWTAEALKNTMPASVFSRSTECHNQDKVSMGTIAARDALRVLELTEQTAAAHLVAVRHALELRVRSGEIDPDRLTGELRSYFEMLAEDIPFVTEDRPLEADLKRLIARIQGQEWPLYREET